MDFVNLAIFGAMPAHEAIGILMNALIETPNLGPVTIATNVIDYFCQQIVGSDFAQATEEVAQILQSQEIEQLGIPSLISNRVSSNGSDPNAIEFWVHMSSSMVFTVLPREGYKVVSMAVKQDMEGFVSEKG